MTSDFIKDTEDKFNSEYESFHNGNIKLFKEFLKTLSSDELIVFIRWLQAEGLTI